MVNSPTERENVIVLKSAERDTCSWHTHFSDDLPFVLLGVIDFAVTIHLVSNESANHIDKVLDCADRMVCMRENHVSNRVEGSEKVIVSVAIFEVDSHLLKESTCEIDSPSFSCDGARIEWHLVLHLNRLFFELIYLKPVKLYASLIPLEGVKPLGSLWTKTALDIVINSEIPLHQVIKVVYNLVSIFVKKSLQFAHLFIVIEIFLIL